MNIDAIAEAGEYEEVVRPEWSADDDRPIDLWPAGYTACLVEHAVGAPSTRVVVVCAGGRR